MTAMSQVCMARDAIHADAAFLTRVDDLAEAERDGWRLDLFGTE